MVSALGYVNEKDKSFEHMSSLHFDFFSNQELNWYGKPRGMIIENFLKEEYDILIDLTLHSFIHYHIWQLPLQQSLKLED